MMGGRGPLLKVMLYGAHSHSNIFTGIFKAEWVRYKTYNQIEMFGLSAFTETVPGASVVLIGCVQDICGCQPLGRGVCTTSE